MLSTAATNQIRNSNTLSICVVKYEIEIMLRCEIVHNRNHVSQAFNIVRQHSNSLLHLLALMATSNIPGVNADAISYVQKALLPEKSKAEAAAVFARMIEDSLRSWFTQFNFFLHNLAQLRFHGDHNDDRLLSFVPRTFTLTTDGRIVEVIGCK